jgi:hypothetical protein
MKISELNWVFYMPILSIIVSSIAFLNMVLFLGFSSYSKSLQYLLAGLRFRITLSIISAILGLIAYPLVLLNFLMMHSISFNDIALGMGSTAILWGVGSYAGMTLATYIFGPKKECK